MNTAGASTGRLVRGLAVTAPEQRDMELRRFEPGEKLIERNSPRLVEMVPLYKILEAKE